MTPLVPLKPTLYALLGLTLVISVVTDLRLRRIFDLVTYPAIGVMLAARFFLEGLGDPEHGLICGLIGAGAGLLAFGVVALSSKGLGWGDVKLVVAVGAGLGYPLALAALLFITLAGALQAVVTMIWQGSVSDTLRRLGRRKPASPEGLPPRGLPYGVAIALGSFWAMWWDGTQGS